MSPELGPTCHPGCPNPGAYVPDQGHPRLCPTRQGRRAGPRGVVKLPGKGNAFPPCPHRMDCPPQCPPDASFWLQPDLLPQEGVRLHCLLGGPLNPGGVLLGGQAMGLGWLGGHETGPGKPSLAPATLPPPCSRGAPVAAVYGVLDLWAGPRPWSQLLGPATHQDLPSAKTCQVGPHGLSPPGLVRACQGWASSTPWPSATGTQPVCPAPSPRTGLPPGGSDAA